MSQYKYKQITPDRTISSVASYAAGEIIFRFQQSGDKVWHPKNTVLRARCQLSKSTSAPVASNVNLALQDGYAINMDFLAATMQRIELRCNNRHVQSIDTYVGQCDMLYKRMNRSKEWLDGVGAECEYTEAQVHKRINRFAVDGRVNTLTNIISAGAGGIQDVSFELSEHLKSFECMWRPGMDFFDIDTAGQGNWSLHLTPMSNVSDIQNNAIESTNTTIPVFPPPTSPIASIDFDITNLYLDVAESVRPNFVQQPLTLRNIRCYPTPYTQGANSFIPTTVQVGLNCSGLTFAVQTSSYNTNTRCSATKFTLPLSNGTTNADFTTTGYAETTLTQLNLNFKGMNAFDQDLEPQYASGTVNYLREMYNRNLLNLGRYGDVKSGESFDDWLQRGIFLYAPFYDGKMATDPSAVVRCKFSGNLNANDVARILVFSHEDVQVDFESEAGVIADVRVVPV